jgi:hypothetical protein
LRTVLGAGRVRIGELVPDKVYISGDPSAPKRDNEAQIRELKLAGFERLRRREGQQQDAGDATVCMANLCHSAQKFVWPDRGEKQVRRATRYATPP